MAEMEGVAWPHGAAPEMERRCRGMEIDTDSGLTRSALTIGADALCIPITHILERRNGGGDICAVLVVKHYPVGMNVYGFALCCFAVPA